MALARTRSPGQRKNFFFLQNQSAHTQLSTARSLSLFLSCSLSCCFAIPLQWKKLHFNVVASFDLHNKTFAYCCRVEANSSNNNSGLCEGWWEAAAAVILFVPFYFYFNMIFAQSFGFGRCTLAAAAASASCRPCVDVSKVVCRMSLCVIVASFRLYLWLKLLCSRKMVFTIHCEQRCFHMLCICMTVSYAASCLCNALREIFLSSLFLFNGPERINC